MEIHFNRRTCGHDDWWRTKPCTLATEETLIVFCDGLAYRALFYNGWSRSILENHHPAALTRPLEGCILGNNSSSCFQTPKADCSAARTWYVSSIGIYMPMTTFSMSDEGGQVAIQHRWVRLGHSWLCPLCASSFCKENTPMFSRFASFLRRKHLQHRFWMQEECRRHYCE